MTGPKAAPVRRPRRSNSLKDIKRLLDTAGTTYGRSERLASHARYFVNPTMGQVRGPVGVSWTPLPHIALRFGLFGFENENRADGVVLRANVLAANIISAPALQGLGSEYIIDPRGVEFSTEPASEAAAWIRPIYPMFAVDWTAGGPELRQPDPSTYLLRPRTRTDACVFSSGC
jgi:hypothetical protein